MTTSSVTGNDFWNETLPSSFPPPTLNTKNDALAYSLDLDCSMLLDAYYHGIFPWPYTEENIIWASPLMRGILPVDKVHIAKSLARELKKNLFTVHADTCFDDVIDACASTERPDGPGTWITSKIRRCYKEFHRLGYAHSFEAFDQDGTLVGGLYGIIIGRIFCGESMFFHKSGASKIAFCKAIEALRNIGIELIDTQTVTNLTSSFGAYEIPREDYLKLLEKLRGSKPTPGIFKL